MKTKEYKNIEKMCVFCGSVDVTLFYCFYDKNEFKELIEKKEFAFLRMSNV